MAASRSSSESVQTAPAGCGTEADDGRPGIKSSGFRPKIEHALIARLTLALPQSILTGRLTGFPQDYCLQILGIHVDFVYATSDEIDDKEVNIPGRISMVIVKKRVECPLAGKRIPDLLGMFA